MLVPEAKTINTNHSVRRLRQSNDGMSQPGPNWPMRIRIYVEWGAAPLVYLLLLWGEGDSESRFLFQHLYPVYLFKCLLF